MTTAQQHVVRLDVAVDYPGLVRIRQRVEHVSPYRDRLAHRHLARAQTAAQCIAFHVRHRVPQRAGIFTGGEHRHDVWVLQAGDELHLTSKSVGVDRGRHVGGQHLEHHPPPERDLLGNEYATHAATTELPLHTVAVAQLGPKLS